MSWSRFDPRAGARLAGLALIGLLAVLLVAPPAQAQGWKFELFAGYYLPEELDEDLAYGLAFGMRSNDQFGWLVSGSWFDVADSQGFDSRDIDADLFHVDFSFMWYPGGGDFTAYGGPGFASANIDVPGVTTDLSDDVFSLHLGIAYEIGIGENFYLKPDGRLRWYELDGGLGKETQIDYAVTLALGWR